jgi:tetraacyldisaccharide 4'-kinase
MHEPAFWWRDGSPFAGLLAPLAAAYGTIAARRLMQPGARARVPVVCIGNLTVGGSGKTPTAIAVARALQAAGATPAFLTRGYGGRLAGPVAVAPAHGAAEIGDEPLLLARVAPTIVARDRRAGAAAAIAAGADTIVMDDGFQNPALAKDFSLVVIDGRRGIGNGNVFPAGPLRAPLAAQLARAQALLVVEAPSAAANGVLAAGRACGLPVLNARLVPDAAAVASLAGRRVLAFAGIADPEKFFATLTAAGIPPAATRRFPDHHRFSAAQAAELIAAAERDGLALVTTEKDAARMQGDAGRGAALAALAARAVPFPVRLMFDDEEALRQVVERVQSLQDRA